MNVLVVGCGSIGERHIANLNALSVGRIVVCDLDAHRLDHIARKYDVEEATTKFESAMTSDVDAVFVCTPPSSHVPIALQAVRRNKHVFIEKPLSNSLQKVDALSQCAASSDLIVCVGYNFRFSAGLNLIRDELRRGAIGKPLYVRAHYGQYLPDWRPWQDYKTSYTAKKKLGGGIILDSSHELDYVRWIFGEVESVFCLAERTSSLAVETEDTAEIVLKFKNGVIGNVHVDFVRHGYVRECEIVGEDGYFSWDHGTHTVKVLARNLNEEKAILLNQSTNQMYVDEIRNFLDSVRGIEMPLVTLKESKATLKLALYAKLSAQTGKNIKVKERDVSNTVVIIQARMGSTRLPGKVMMDVAGHPLLWHIIDRVRRARLVNNIVVATSTQERDKVVRDLAKQCNVGYFAGSEEDVLDRYCKAAKKFNADVVVRLTGDDPLVDATMIDKVVATYWQNKDSVDYVSNSITPTYPEGYDVEVFSSAALEVAWKEAQAPIYREHVTAYIWTHPDKFTLLNVENNEGDLSKLRFTVDTEADYRFVNAVFSRLYTEGQAFSLRDVVRLLNQHPELTEINKNAERRTSFAAIKRTVGE